MTATITYTDGLTLPDGSHGLVWIAVLEPARLTPGGPELTTRQLVTRP